MPIRKRPRHARSLRNLQSEEGTADILKRIDIYYDRRHREDPGHEQLFGYIEAISKTTWEEYQSHVKNVQEPFGNHLLLERAHFLSVRAQECLKSQGNEALWRSRMASVVLHRFDDVADW